MAGNSLRAGPLSLLLLPASPAVRTLLDPCEASVDIEVNEERAFFDPKLTTLVSYRGSLKSIMQVRQTIKAQRVKGFVEGKQVSKQ